MKNSLTLFLLILSVSACLSNNKSVDEKSHQFKLYVQSILSDSSNRWQEYPKPPAITDSVLVRLEPELKDDSTKYFFDRFSANKFKSSEYQTAIDYFYSHKKFYTLLSLSVHWNPDVRVYSLTKFKTVFLERGLICGGKSVYDGFYIDNRTALKFLIYVLESNPFMITGSENSTIHGVYISNILWMLDLLTGERIVDFKEARDWYKNDLQYENAILKWKSYIPKDR